jgi:hypothetical protein
MSKIGLNLERFRQAVAIHDRLNPAHTSYGIGMAYFDMKRLDFEEGEELWPGIRIECDGKGAGNFRVLCDGEHDEASGQQLKEAAPVDAVSKETIPA